MPKPEKSRMQNVLPKIKKTVMLVQALALFFYSPSGLSASVNSPLLATQQLILTTDPIETSAGRTHIEVQAFEINTEQDLARAKEELSAQVEKDSKINELFVLDVRTADYKTTDLNGSAQKILNEIEDSSSAQNKIKTKPLVVDPPDKKGFFKRHYNLSLAIVRFVANAATVSTGLVLASGVPIEHALLVGVLAGSISGALQIKSEAYLKWISNSVLLVKAAKKAGLLSKKDGGAGSRGERALKEIEMYAKWGSIEVAFLFVCQTAMSLLNIPIAENLFLTAAKSTLSQGVFEVGISKATQQLEKINSKWNKRAAVFRDVSLFGGSSLSVLAAIGAMAGMPFANLAFITLTGTGLVLNFVPKLVRLKPTETILNKWRRTGSVIKCRMLFE